MAIAIPMSDEDIEALRKRNAKRLQAAIKSLGPKWVLHKTNAPQRKAPVAKGAQS